MIKGKGQRLIPEELLKYLEALKKDHSDPSAEWGSSGELYEHCLTFEKAGIGAHINLIFYNDSSTAISAGAVITILYEKGFTSGNKFYPANGYLEDGEIVLGIRAQNSMNYTISCEIISEGALAHTTKDTAFNNWTCTDNIIKLI